MTIGRSAYILCGYSCAGKTTGAIGLKEAVGLRHFEASNFMKALWRESNNNLHIEEFAYGIMKNNPTAVPDLIIKECEINSYPDVVISGFRSPQETRRVRLAFENCLICFVEADLEIRFRRSLVRGKPSDMRSLEELSDLDQLHDQMGVGQIRNDEADIIILNEDSINEFLQTITSTIYAHRTQ